MQEQNIFHWVDIKSKPPIRNLNTELSDSKRRSMSEAAVNAIGAYPIGYFVGILFLPLVSGWLVEDPYAANIIITAVYATTSFIRTYFLRRVFIKLHIDDNFIRLAIRSFIRLRDSYNRQHKCSDTQ